MKKCEPNASMVMQEKRYMTSKIFLEWPKHFVKNILGEISKDNKNLVILDQHALYITIETIYYGLEVGLDIFTILVYSSHEI